MTSRTYWNIGLVGIIAAGLASRVVHTGWVVVDKYLGDALYAAMVYAIIRVMWPGAGWRCGVLAMGIMVAIEVFQLTTIPAGWAASASWPVHIVGRLLGTQFAWLDLAAYAVGIAGIGLVDWAGSKFGGQKQVRRSIGPEVQSKTT